MTKEMDMTTGHPRKLIFAFAVPLMIGNVFQQLYTTVDTLIVGQVAGVDALAAVGSADWSVWMLQGVLIGLTQAGTILVSQNIGAQNYHDAKKAISSEIVSTTMIAILLTLSIESGLSPFLHLLNIPDNIFSMTQQYLSIIFIGLPFVAVYNFAASIHRAVGNSKTPLHAMLIASITNIILDVIFVIFLKKGVAGAAIATIISQLLSAIICMNHLFDNPNIKPDKEDIRHYNDKMKALLNLAMPIIFQNVIISVGGLVVQAVINKFGSLTIAGFTATNKLYGILELAAVSYGYAIVTYVGQNYGAKQYQRIKDGIKEANLISLFTSLFISILMIVFGKLILSLFISSSSADRTMVLAIAYRYLTIMAIFLPVLYFLYVYRSALQGLGNTFLPMISGIVELVLRVSVALFLPYLFQDDALYYVEVSAWTGSMIFLAISYLLISKKLLK